MFCLVCNVIRYKWRSRGSQAGRRGVFGHMVFSRHLKRGLVSTGEIHRMMSGGDPLALGAVMVG